MTMRRLSGVVLVLVFAACGAPQKSQQQQATEVGAEPAAGGEAAPPSSGGEYTCNTACTNIATCGQQTVEECLSQCEGSEAATPEFLQEMTHITCDEMQARHDAAKSGGGGGGGGGGQGCRTNGTNDCGMGEICCAPGGGATSIGRPGMCQSAAICNMPRR